MNQECPCWKHLEFNFYPKIGHWVRHGTYFRKSDSKRIERLQCTACLRTISKATGSVCFGQNKRRLNPLIFRLLCSGNTQRRIARYLGVNRKTVVRKFLFLAKQKRKEHEVFLKTMRTNEIQFDEMETHEVSKWKPLSIALAVDSERRILGATVSRMPARGLEARKAIAKYGFRPDERKHGMESLFSLIKEAILPEAQFRSDEKTMYPGLVRRHFPGSNHATYKGRRGCVVGQGELKRIGKDPLFCLNHTAAMLRANLNRLVRRTWSVTQKPERLLDHLYLYMSYHNQVLLKT